MKRTSLFKVLASISLGLPLIAWAQWGPQNDHSSDGGYNSGDRNYSNDSSGRGYSNEENGSGQRNASNGTVWFSQSFPSGAQSFQKGTAGGSGLWEMGFTNASTPLQINSGEELFCWVNLNSSSQPREIMLSWNDGSSWEHRAYWGQNILTYGKDDSPSRMSAGDIPGGGGWTKLTVPASSVGLTSGNVTGMSVSVEGGSVQFGAVGVEPSGIGQSGPGPTGQMSNSNHQNEEDQNPYSNRNHNNNGDRYNRTYQNPPRSNYDDRYNPNNEPNDSYDRRDSDRYHRNDNYPPPPPNSDDGPDR